MSLSASYSILSVLCRSQTFLFHSFEISPRCGIVVFCVLPLLFAFSIFSKFVTSVFLYSILLKHAASLIERFGQICMTKEQSEMLMLMNHPFARPLIALGPYVVRTDRNH